MSLSFREYMIVADAFEENQLDENKLVQAVTDYFKKKFGKEPSKDEVEAEVAKLKGEKEKNLQRIQNTQQYRAWAARKAQREKQQTVGTRPTIGTGPSPLDAKSTPHMRAGELRAAERAWRGEGKDVDGALVEGMADFIVSYTTRLGGGNKTKRTIIRGRDARDVRRKFGDSFYGAKVLSVEPHRERQFRQRQEEPESFDEVDDSTK